MSVNLNKFVTNSLPEFLLLALEPNALFATEISAVLESLRSVVVCYDLQYFFKNHEAIASNSGPVKNRVGFDEFVAYCESKIQPRFTVERDADTSYRCCMTVSDLVQTEPWARLYAHVGTNFMKYLLFNCLLFVPLREDVYYCVHGPCQRSDRYEVLQSFWTRAGMRWNGFRKRRDGRDCDRSKTNRFSIANLLKDVGAICQTDADGMLRQIMSTRGGGDKTADRDDDIRFVALKSALNAIARKDTVRTYKRIYDDVIGDFAEIPLGRVKKFATAVVRKIVPRRLFGVNGNRDQYCKNLCTVMNSGKFHEFTVQHIMHKIKVKKVHWLDPVDADRRTEIMTKTMVWLTNVFVFGRIARFFQVVTTNSPNNGIVYFSKAKWATMCRDKISPLMSGGEFFKEVRPDVSAGSYRNWKVCPYAKPNNGVRLIFKLKRKEDGVKKPLMDDCLTFLRCLLRTYPAEYRTVSRPQFFRGWKAFQESRDPGSPVYYVRTDFRDAFTSVEQDKLQAIVRNRIRECYGKRSRSLSVHSVDVVKISGSNGAVYCKKRKYFDGLPAPDFPGGSLVFYEKTAAVSLTSVWDVVRKCVRRNAVERGGRTWSMTRGIVQGDRLSVALCDLLLADLHATRLKDLVDSAPGCRLYRFVDDYVFVSSDRTAARLFLNAMRAGFDEYGLRLNATKTETNVRADGGDGPVKFLGFRLNAVTGEVTKDEGAFRKRRPFHFFDFDLGRGRPGRAVFARMTAPDRHPLPAILVSESLNSASTVARNLASVVAYKAFAVVTAVQQYFFHLNPEFLVKLVRAVARLMYAKVCGLIRHSAVTPMQCKWIVYEVYATVFRRRFSADDDCRFAWIVDRLRDLQTAVGRKCDTRDLKTALKRHPFAKMFD